MRIRYNGHSCFSIFSADGKCVVIDPYQSGSFGGGPIAYFPVDSKPDVVLVTHNHPDHNSVSQFQGDFTVLRDSGEAKGIAFEAVGAFHDKSGGHDRGRINIFKFTMDGIRVVHVGDLGQILTAEQIEKIGETDVLMVPVGGFYTIDANEATDAVQRINPKIALPMHYKTDKCGFDIAEVYDFLKGKDNVKKPDTDEIELSADKLPGKMEIIVLKHRL